LICIRGFERLVFCCLGAVKIDKGLDSC
jgi:hypothetical protein